jgi:hypothetical protein
MTDLTQTLEPGASPADLIARLRRRYVKTPRDRAILDHLGRVLARDADGRPMLEPMRFGPEQETRGVIVPAPSGEGKSSLIGHALSGFRQVDADHGASHDANADATHSEATMLRLVTPSPGTMKSLGLEILERTGYSDVSERRERWSIWKIVRHRLALRRVRLVWLDEAQHILSEGSPAERRTALDAIKTLMAGESACTVILSGVASLEQIRTIDPQIERRFTFFPLQPMTGPRERRRLRIILEEFCAAAALGAPAASDLVDRILHGVDGRFGRAIEMMVEAVALAVEQRATALDLQHFAESWAITAGCAPVVNVFVADKWADIASVSEESEEQTGAAGRGRRKRRGAA